MTKMITGLLVKELVMAKMSKNQLKSLIKECLVEVLVEGLNPKSNSSMSLQETKTRTSKQSKRRASSRPAVENINFDKRINESVSACTEDPILGNILADTARTTLQEQLGQEKNQPSHATQVSANGDPAAKAISSSDPNDVFGNAANNWAALAFDEVNK